MADHLRRLRIYEMDLEVERIYRDRNNPLKFYSDDEFRCRFHLRKDNVVAIIDYVDEDLQHLTYRNEAVSLYCRCARAFDFWRREPSTSLWGTLPLAFPVLRYAEQCLA